MPLIYRSVKGSALTISEIDGNFAYFTGSHAVTGSLTISGANASSSITLLNVPNYADNNEALAAGLTVGMIYRSGDFLWIVNND